jgi:hypothetical protein
MGLMGRTFSFPDEGGKVRNRRVSPVAPNPGEGLLTEPTAGTQPERRELVFMPLKRPCQREGATARLGGNRTLAADFCAR